MKLDEVRNPHIERPQGESNIVEITRQYIRFSVRVFSAPLIRHIALEYYDTGTLTADAKFIRSC
jgi:hypothetical protein